MGEFMRLVGRESYRMRSCAAYPGDRVQVREWLINGKRYEFTRIAWGDGSVTVRAYRDGQVWPFREVTRCGGWQTDPAYLGEACDHTWGCVPPCGQDDGPRGRSQWEINETAMP